MKRCKMLYFSSLMLLTLSGLSSCTTNSGKADNQEIQVMDSVSKDLETTSRDLEVKIKKVEASLEKLDKEIATAK